MICNLQLYQLITLYNDINEINEIVVLHETFRKFCLKLFLQDKIESPFKGPFFTNSPTKGLKINWQSQ